MSCSTNEIVKEKSCRLLIIIFALTLSAIVYNLFLLPLNIVSGGASGIAIITNYLYNIEPSVMIFIISTICIIISLIFLGIEKTIATLIASFLYPALIELTNPITNLIKIPTDDMLIIVLFAGILTGISNGLIYRAGYNSGGLNTICQIFFEKYKIPIDKTNLLLNSIIIISGGFLFGSTNAMYAIILLYISNVVLTKVLLGISTNKAFYIVTTEEKEIRDYVITQLKRSVTIFDVKGGFLEKKRNILLVVIPSKSYYKLTEGIKTIDKNAFFIATDAYEVSQKDSNVDI